jgi:hypothetical protein
MIEAGQGLSIIGSLFIVLGAVGIGEAEDNFHNNKNLSFEGKESLGGVELAGFGLMIGGAANIICGGTLWGIGNRTPAH